jgi:putative chitinase
MAGSLFAATVSIGLAGGQETFPTLTDKQLHAIMPNLSKERAAKFLGALNAAMKEYEINTRKRQAAFLAQLAHESGELRYMEEIASGEAYEGRKDLGNTQKGDGKRFKGRGPIQLTGRYNYRRAGEALGLDLEQNPEKVATAEVGTRVAGWFWKTHGLNELADKGDYKEITRRINGGYHGLPNRQTYYRRALDVLQPGK